MKKVLLFAATAAMLAACSSEELATSTALETAEKGTPVNFSAYTPRTVTRAGIDGTNDNTNIGERGFGVFAYYTAGQKYDTNATPNFMYNQKVVTDENPAAITTKAASEWTYEPVKYWPNEFGDAAISDDIDYVSFFSYAPWINVTPATGLPVVEATDDNLDAFCKNMGITGVTDKATWISATGLTEADLIALYTDQVQNKNIIGMTKNNATGDPMIQYVVDTNPGYSVDLLYGVAAASAADDFGTSMSAAAYTPTIEEGKPFIDLVKPAIEIGEPAVEKVSFWLQHALAKVKVTIDYVADYQTPDETPKTDGSDPDDPTGSAVINADHTRLFVRSVTFNGFALQGALNLNSTETMAAGTYTVGKPLWKTLDGASDLSFDDIIFQDGRKDGKEGATNSAQTSEKPVGLNPLIVENEGYVVPATSTVLAHWADATEASTAGKTEKTPGVTNTAVNLFGGSDVNDGFFYVIPRNNGEGVNMTIAYDVETIDDNLAGKLSDNATLGSTIENVITKNNIFGTDLDFKPGFQYEIHIHLGMTSVKIDAEVVEWQDGANTNVNLPANN